MLDFFNNLIEFFSNSLIVLFNVIIYILNLAIWLICGLINLLVNLLPNSPFSNINIFEGNEKYIGYLNWILPIDFILGVSAAWAGCMILYWGYSIIMRYFKIIE